MDKNIAIKFILLSIFFFTFEGCTYRAVHDTLHNVAKRNCRNIINPQQRQECESKHQNVDYRSYRYEYDKHTDK